MKTLYLHIGTPKTASTTIQAFCVANRELLARQGYCYPDLGFRYRGKNENRNGVFLGGIYYDKERVRHPEIEAQNFREGMNRVQELFQQYDNVILSDEGIWWDAHTKRRRTLWKELRGCQERGGYQIRVIVYLRRQDQLVESQWNQRIKHAVALEHTLTWEEFLGDYDKYVAPDYAADLKRMEKELGREALIVRRFQRDSFFGGDILRDFLHQIGLELTEAYQLPEAELNQRFSGNIVEFKRILNGMEGMDDHGRDTMEEILMRCTADSERDYPTQMFSPEEARAFAGRFEKGNRQIAERYIRDGKPLFSDVFQEKPRWSRDNPCLLRDVVRMSGQSTLYLLERQEALLKRQESLLERQEAQKQELQAQIEAQYRELCELRTTVETLRSAERAQERRYRRLLKMLKHPFRTLFRKLFGGRQR